MCHCPRNDAPNPAHVKPAHATYGVLQPIGQPSDNSGPRPEFEDCIRGGHESKKRGQSPPRPCATWTSKQTSNEQRPSLCQAYEEGQGGGREERRRRLDQEDAERETQEHTAQPITIKLKKDSGINPIREY